MLLSNFAKREITDIFDMYSGIESGFSKTILPLKIYLTLLPFPVPRQK